MLSLKGLVPNDPEFRHVCDFFQQGTYDSVWIPQIASEEGWIVITSDGGRNPSKGGKLPELCREHKITHVILSPTLHNKTAADKVAALLLVWNEIELLQKVPPGSRFKLRYKHTKGVAGLRIVLEKVVETAKPRRKKKRRPNG